MSSRLESCGKWELSPEKIVFNGTEATLHFGTIAVNIGDENFDDRVAQITPILEKLQGKSGTVHLGKLYNAVNADQLPADSRGRRWNCDRRGRSDT